MRKNWRIVAVWLAVAVMAWGLAGCGEDDPTTPPDEEDPIGPIDTADKAILEFVRVYEGRDLTAYSDRLSADFEFVGQPDLKYDRDQEIAISQKIFEEIAGAGGAVVEDIRIEQLQPLGTWAEVPMNDPDFGTYSTALYRPYNVLINFLLSNVALTLKAQGLAVFYVIDEGTDTEYNFVLLGIVDGTEGKQATENSSWSSVKSLFE